MASTVSYGLSPVPDWRQQAWNHEGAAASSSSCGSYQWTGYTHHSSPVYQGLQQASPAPLQLSNLIPNEGPAHSSFLHRYPHEMTVPANYQDAQGAYCQSRSSPTINASLAGLSVIGPSFDANRMHADSPDANASGGEAPSAAPGAATAGASGSSPVGGASAAADFAQVVPPPDHSNSQTVTHANMYLLPQVNESYEAVQETLPRVKGEVFQDGSYTHPPSPSWSSVSSACI